MVAQPGGQRFIGVRVLVGGGIAVEPSLSLCGHWNYKKVLLPSWRGWWLLTITAFGRLSLLDRRMWRLSRWLVVALLDVDSGKRVGHWSNILEIGYWALALVEQLYSRLSPSVWFWLWTQKDRPLWACVAPSERDLLLGGCQVLKYNSIANWTKICEELGGGWLVARRV